jgi:hypothetical protein
MKLSDLAIETPQPEESEWPYLASSLAEPPITLAEAQAVDLGRDSTVCRWHGGRFSHLSIEGHVYYCPVGRMLFRHSKLPSEALKPLDYGWNFRG